MSIKAYKGLVVPFPCQKSWKWMLDSNVPRCNNCEKESGTCCLYINCMDCVYNTAVAKADYYNYCFPEENRKALPKLTQEVFDRPDCPEWAEWALVDRSGRGYWSEKEPRLGPCSGNWILPGRSERILGNETLFDASDWVTSRISRPVKCVCNSCKNYEPKNSPDREMLPVYEFDWYTQWKYSQREDKYYYIEDIRKNRARELKTGELVNELPADVIVVRPTDPDLALLVAAVVQHVPTGNYYVIQKVESDGSRIYVKDMDWEKSEFYKNFIDKWGRPVCYFERLHKD